MIKSLFLIILVLAIIVTPAAYASSNINIVKNHSKDTCKKASSHRYGFVYICKDIVTNKRYLASTEPVMTTKVIVNDNNISKTKDVIASQPIDDNISKAQVIKAAGKSSLLYLDYSQLCFIDNDTDCVNSQKNFIIQNITTTLGSKGGWEVQGLVNDLSSGYTDAVHLQLLFYDKKGNSIAGYVGRTIGGLYPNAPVPFDIKTVEYHVHPYFFTVKVTYNDTSSGRQ